MRQDPFRILSLSGGGVRGVFQAAFLRALSQHLTVDLTSYFDLLAGTSTGAITAVALGMGVSPDHILDLFRSEGHRIFDPHLLWPFRHGSRYGCDALRDALRGVLGDRRLGESSLPLLIAATGLDEYGHRIFSTLRPDRRDADLKAVDVLLASTAAPTYFPPFQFEGRQRAFVDGGLWANAPSLLAVLDSHRIGIPFESMRLLAVATGDVRGMPVNEYQEMVPVIPNTTSSVMEIMFGAQESYALESAQVLIGRANVLRISPDLEKQIRLDDVDAALSILPGKAEAKAEIMSDTVREMFAPTGDRSAIPMRSRYLTLAPRELIAAAGLTAFYPSRDYYQTHRVHASSIDRYVDSARKSVVMVSISLQTGIPFDGLLATLTRKIVSAQGEFNATISLLDPRIDYLMKAMAPVLSVSPSTLAADIKLSLSRMLQAREDLPPELREHLKLWAHPAIPAGSAILIDHEEPHGRVQIEAKPYHVGLRKSFAFEVGRTGIDGLYESLVDGYLRLLQDGVKVDQSWIE